MCAAGAGVGEGVVATGNTAGAAGVKGLRAEGAAGGKVFGRAAGSFNSEDGPGGVRGLRGRSPGGVGGAAIPEGTDPGTKGGALGAPTEGIGFGGSFSGGSLTGPAEGSGDDGGVLESLMKNGGRLKEFLVKRRRLASVNDPNRRTDRSLVGSDPKDYFLSLVHAVFNP